MITSSRQKTEAVPTHPAHANHAAAPSDVLVFIEDPTVPPPSLRHAQKVAGALGGKVVLIHVQCRSDDDDGPIDPIKWDIRKQKAMNWLTRLVQSADDADAPCEAKLLEGPCIRQIQSYLEKHQVDIAATMRSHGDNPWHLSETCWGVLSSRSAAVLMIPAETQIAADKPYLRILVPLDGSARAEMALPKAIRLAKAETSELMLCYVAPEPGLTEFGGRDQEAQRLHDMVRKRNEQAGKTYLAGIKNRLAHNGLKITTSISRSGDARRALIDAVTQHKADFVVMATHGQSGHKDVPTGDVARFVFDRADVPVLLVRYRNGRDGNHAFGNVASTGVRQPAGTD